eukprot:scpid98376/ scgid12986/ 
MLVLAANPMLCAMVRNGWGTQHFSISCTANRGVITAMPWFHCKFRDISRLTPFGVAPRPLLTGVPRRRDMPRRRDVPSALLSGIGPDSHHSFVFTKINGVVSKLQPGLALSCPKQGG